MNKNKLGLKAESISAPSELNKSLKRSSVWQIDTHFISGKAWETLFSTFLSSQRAGPAKIKRSSLSIISIQRRRASEEIYPIRSQPSIGAVCLQHTPVARHVHWIRDGPNILKPINDELNDIEWKINDELGYEHYNVCLTLSWAKLDFCLGRGVSRCDILVSRDGFYEVHVICHVFYYMCEYY